MVSFNPEVYGPIFEPHAHLRDFEHAYKDTMAHALAVCDRQGVAGILDMAWNKKRPVNSPDLVRECLARAKESDAKAVYGINVGVPLDNDDIERLLDFFQGNNEDAKHIAMLKIADGSTTGSEGMSKERREWLFEQLYQRKFNGVLGQHCEDESHFTDAWNPNTPSSWNQARNDEAEYQSVINIIALYEKFPFPGTVYVPHISSINAVNAIDEAQRRGIPIVCAATYQGLFVPVERMDEASREILTPKGNEDYEQLPPELAQRKIGLCLKQNPPLRPEDEIINLRADGLRAGKIRFVESDHAPHSLHDKFVSYMSGNAVLGAIARLQMFLVDEMGYDETRQLTWDNVLGVFRSSRPELVARIEERGEQIQKELSSGELQIEDCTDEYPVDCFANIIPRLDTE